MYVSMEHIAPQSSQDARVLLCFRCAGKSNPCLPVTPTNPLRLLLLVVAAAVRVGWSSPVLMAASCAETRWTTASTSPTRPTCLTSGPSCLAQLLLAHTEQGCVFSWGVGVWSGGGGGGRHAY